MRNTATAFAQAADPARATPPPPAPADILEDLVEAPTASTHFRTAMSLSRRKERRQFLGNVCFFVS